jgi:HAMP domain-containing protein
MSALGLVLLALLLVWRISQRIVRPIDALHSAAAKVSAGQTQARVMLEVGPRELQAVAVEFNRMLDSRERFLTHLAGSEERFRTLASLPPIGTGSRMHSTGLFAWKAGLSKTWGCPNRRFWARRAGSYRHST